MSSPRVRIGLVGDFDPRVTAHQAIPNALALAGRDLALDVEFEWIHTTRLSPVPATLGAFAGLWCVPATPYADTEAVLAAIQHAREHDRPLLATCGGFQHLVLEYARTVLGVSGAAHAELDPDAADPLIAPLDCPMVERIGAIRFVPGSRIARAYGVAETTEGYHCRYGVAPRFESLFDAGPLRITARDGDGEVRAMELDAHPFFVGTLFQPERRALSGRTPPIVRAFVEAAARA